MPRNSVCKGQRLAVFFLLLVRRKAVNTSEKYTVTCSPVTFSDMLYMKLLKLLEWLFISVLVYVVLDNVLPRTYKARWR